MLKHRHSAEPTSLYIALRAQAVQEHDMISITLAAESNLAVWSVALLRQCDTRQDSCPIPGRSSDPRHFRSAREGRTIRALITPLPCAITPPSCYRGPFRREPEDSIGQRSFRWGSGTARASRNRLPAAPSRIASRNDAAQEAACLRFTLAAIFCA